MSARLRSPGPTTDARPLAAADTLEITSAGTSRGLLSEIWRGRDLLLILAGRDVRLRYRQTALGVVWVVLLPVIGAAIFAFVFGRVAHLRSEGVAYFLFAYTGLVLWNFVSQTITRVTASLVGNAQLVSKVFFPRLILPLSTVLSTLLDLSVGLLVLVVLIPAYGVPLRFSLLLAPLWVLCALTLALGIGLVAAAAVVSYRDVQHVLPVGLQLLLYISPVAYAAAAVPAGVRRFYVANPLVGVLEGFRSAVLGTTPPTGRAIAYSLAAALIAAGGGVVSFVHMEQKFADVI
ncbi:MAG: ABC transporter permease [Actinobacteria bacterium]|nr:ABC transporter permease [Actinomycetota bacterium]